MAKPVMSSMYSVWMGKLHPPEHFRQRYHVDACGFADEVAATVRAALASSPGPVHVLQGTNSDSGLDHAAVLPTHEAMPPGITAKCDALYEIAAECRVTKSAGEIDVMRYVSWVSSCAHASVMADAKHGMMEYQVPDEA